MIDALDTGTLLLASYTFEDGLTMADGRELL